MNYLRVSRTSTSRRTPYILLAAFGFLFLLTPLRAKEFWSDAGFFIDLPEGFSLAEGDGKTRFSFLDPTEGMEFDILSYDASRFQGAKALADESLKRLGSSGESENFAYEGREAVFAELSFKLGGAQKKGYAIFIAGRKTPEKGGAGADAKEANRPGEKSGATSPGSPPERHTALLAWTDETRLENYADFILSCLDCVSLDGAGLRSPGPLSQYILPWPAARNETRKVEFGGESFELPFSSDESEHVAGTAGREFRVLEAYGETEDLWKAAWARCYRMIFRESARRLDRLTLEIARLLPDDPTEAARRMLAWVQGFTYVRDTEGIDFVEPLVAAYEARGDCDSRAVVMAAVLERLGVDSILMLSRDYSHAMAAFDVPGGGQRFPFGGKEWLVAETTAKVGIGLVAAKQSDWKKWLGVDLGK